MQLVTIEAKSHKGKNKIAQALRRLPNWNGKTWRLKRKETRVLFDSDPGPWGFVEPDTDENTDWCSRWVNLRDDKNFTVTANAEFSGGAPLYGAASAGTQGYASRHKEKT